MTTSHSPGSAAGPGPAEAPLPAEAFYLPVGQDEFETTVATTSPWDVGLQHGGPPAALLARAIERCDPQESMPIARITVDMLGGIPRGRVRTQARIVRPGRRIELIEAELSVDGTPAVRASAWRIRQSEGSTSQFEQPEARPPIPAAEPRRFFEGVPDDWGYGRAVDWRFVAGGFEQESEALVWTRVRIPLVAGEEPTPEQRLLVVADATNGLTAQVPITQWWFIPPSLTVTLQRAPESEWMLIDAHSTIGPHGTGMAQSRMSDEHGLVALVNQPLMVARRS